MKKNYRIQNLIFILLFFLLNHIIYGQTLEHLTVASQNPNISVPVTATCDYYSLCSGTTTFNRYYLINTNVNLQAALVAPGGNIFTEWLRNGSSFSSNRNINFSITSDVTFTAVYSTSVTLTVNSNNPSTGIPITVTPLDLNNNGNGITSFTRTYLQNTFVQVTAPLVAPNGNTFLHWMIGPNQVNENTTGISLDASITITAYYNTVQQSTVTLNTSPQGLSVIFDGSTYTSPATFGCQSGSQHTISTIQNQSGGTGIQYSWSNWSDNQPISHNIIVNSNSSYTAYFNTQYYLNMSSTCGGTISPVSGWYNASTQVQISAGGTLHSTAGSCIFAEWTGSGLGCYLGELISTFITMNSPIFQVARFLAPKLSKPDYILVDETNNEVFGLKYDNGIFDPNPVFTLSSSGGINFVAPCGAVAVNGYLYIADQSSVIHGEGHGRVVKINLANLNQEGEYEVKLPSGVYCQPHDVQCFDNKIFILGQYLNHQNGGLMVICDLNLNPLFSPIILDNYLNDKGSPTRIVKINNVYYLSTFNNIQNSISYVVWFTLTNNYSIQECQALDPTRITEQLSNGKYRIPIVSYGPNNILLVWLFDDFECTNVDNLLRYNNKQYVDMVQVNKSNSDILNYVFQTIDFNNNQILLITGNSFNSQFNVTYKTDYATGGNLSQVSGHGGTYICKNTSSVQYGDLSNGLSTFYRLNNTWVTKILLHDNGLLIQLPDSINVSYNEGQPPNYEGNQTASNCFWQVYNYGGNNFTYDLTLYYDVTKLGNISSENNIRVGQTDANGNWIIYLSEGTGIGQYQLDVTNHKITVYGLSSFSFFTLTDVNNPLPVNMAYFYSVVNDRSLTLKWGTTSEMNNKGFDIEKKVVQSSNWTKIGFVQGHGTTNSPKNYSYQDVRLNSMSYNYRLKQIDYNGNYNYFYLKDSINIGKPKAFSLSQNYPNPGNPKSKIDYRLSFDAKVTLKVYDMLGREVATLVNGNLLAGYYSVIFDGTNLASGAYIYRIIAEGNGQRFSKSLKLVNLK